LLRDFQTGTSVQAYELSPTTRREFLEFLEEYKFREEEGSSSDGGSIPELDEGMHVESLNYISSLSRRVSAQA
jgi:hypothetical protein